MITLVPYDANWPNLFNIEKVKLQDLFGDIVVDIQHIGSTAILGIYAKPVIDILIGVKDLRQFTHQQIEKIESLGYQYIKAFEEQEPYRRFFQKNNKEGKRTYHIHLVNYHSSWWQRHILFRDYLLKHSDVAKGYEKHKLKLASQFNDTNEYAKAKTVFCQSINNKAYFDFDIHKPDVILNRLHGYIPQCACFEVYKKMFQDPDFIKCYGVKFDDKKIKEILEKYIRHWDKHGFGLYVWFDKQTQEFVGRGGLIHTKVEANEEIELGYALSKNNWGKGLAIEISEYAIDYGFNTLKLDHIVCFTMTTNRQSLRVIEKLGFQYEKDFMRYDLPHKLFRMKNPH